MRTVCDLQVKEEQGGLLVVKAVHEGRGLVSHYNEVYPHRRVRWVHRHIPQQNLRT